MTDTGGKRTNNDPAHDRALRDIFRFFLFMALAGMFARGATGAAMPVVTAAAPYYGSVSRTFSVSGTIISGTEKPFLPPEGLWTERVCVQAGDCVQMDGGTVSKAAAALTEEQAQGMKTGDAVTVQQGGISRQAFISALQADEKTGNSKVEIPLPAAEWQIGAAELTFMVQSGGAGLCLPLYAVNADSQGTFVYLIEEKNTVLGIQNTLVRLGVTVEGWGDDMVQISGALDTDSRVAVESTKPLSVGTKVRIHV